MSNHCKNSKQLADKLSTIKVESDELFISHNVVSLFTKTPVDVTLSIAQERLKEGRTLHKRTKLTKDDIHQLLTFVAKLTYFQFKNTIYRQKQGFSRGTRSRPS